MKVLERVRGFTKKEMEVTRYKELEVSFHRQVMALFLIFLPSSSLHREYTIHGNDSKLDFYIQY